MEVRTDYRTPEAAEAELLGKADGDSPLWPLSLRSRREKLMAAAAFALTLAILGTVIGVSLSGGSPATNCNLATLNSSGYFFDTNCVNFPTNYEYPPSYTTRTLVTLHPTP